ncbi:MAG: protein translocase subunit SecD, partial [Campylobacter sp.]|nr:protein translocase subunit SecD [Campylobacter sp.]
MRSKISFKLIAFIIAAAFGLIFSAPSLFQSESGSKINLGLDLQGGLHMLLEVESDEAIASKIKSIASSVNYSAKKDDLFVEKFRIEKNHFEISI